MENNIGTIKKPRIEYIDSMRGFAMLLVIYGHISLFIFKLESICFDVITSFHMPLFFFICGLMSYTDYHNQNFSQKIRHRITGQLIPTIVVCMLYVATYSLSVSETIFDNFKSGYWFVFVLIECTILYYLMVFLFKTFNSKDNQQFILLSCLIVVTYIARSILFRYSIIDTDFSKLVSLDLLLGNFPYFLMGIIIKMKFQSILNIFSNRYFITLVIVSYIFLFKFRQYGVTLFIQGFLGTIITFCVFKYYKEYFSRETIIGRFLNYIGKHTLEIYLIHYFFIKELSKITEFHNLGIIQESWLIEFFSFIFLACIIACLCLLIVKFVKISPILQALFFGFKTNTQKSFKS